MKFIITSLFILFCGSYASAQKNGSIKGTAMDTLLKQPVPAATVSLLQKKDSSLVSFTMADDAGRFEFKNLAAGDYRILITHANYRNSNAIAVISENDKQVNLGNIVMNDRSRTLSEVTVQSEAPPVTLINDTIQYNAGSFKTAPNANVEQLLKKLPGVKVEKDGTVKAQGEKVSRVLVDGKEFFGSDPKIATKNLPADAVDKVQVYNKQSDQAQLTGFDDGNYEKTINLKLKKDKKKGMFGKVSGGGGTDGKYAGKFNLNSFKGPRQISALGTANNTNAEGFSFSDILNFTGELSRMMQKGGGNVNINFSDKDAAAFGIGNSNTGINTIRGGGLNYNNIIGNKTDLQSNFFYNRFNPYYDSHIQRQYLLPDSSYFYDQYSVENNINDNQRLNVNALYQIDSTSSLRINPSLGYQKTSNHSQSDYSTSGGNKTIANQGNSSSIFNNEGLSFRNDMIYRKKINRRGRTFSLALNTSLNHSTGSGSLLSQNNFYNAAGAVVLRDTINQVNKSSADLRGYTAKMVYTEPLFRRSLLEFSLAHSNTKSSAEKATDDYNPVTGKYDQPDTYLSNNFNNVYSFTQEAVRLRKQKHKYRYSLGAALQQANLEGRLTNSSKDSVLKKSFNNILPDATFGYNFSKFKTASLRYSTATTQPDITQLQPVPDNRDPLNIKLGNPNLTQEYANNIQANLNFVNPYKNKTLFLFLTMQATKNKIVNADSLTSAGIKYTRPVNTNGVYNLNSNISYGFPLHFLGSALEISSNTNYYKNRQFINGVANNIRSLAFGPGLRLDMNPTKKLSLGLGANYNYSHTTYSLQPLVNAKYLSQEYSASADWEMPKKFFFSSDFTYTLNSGRAQGFNNHTPLWNASLSKQVLKYNRGEFKLTAYDLLNSNIGISRTANQNYIEDSRVRTVKRFFMLGFTYSLSKTGLNNAGESGGVRVIGR